MSSSDPSPGPFLWSNLPLWPGKRRRMFEDDGKDGKSDDDDVYVDVETVEGTAADLSGSSKEENIPSIGDLPDELILMLFQYLDPYTLANDASKVCQRWHQLAWDEAPWRLMHLQLDGPEAKELLLKAPALRRLSVHSYGGYEPLLECTTRIFELVITCRRLFDEPEPIPPLEENRFGYAEVLPRFSESLERLSVEVDISDEEFKVIDDHLDLKELRIVSNNLQKFVLCERPRSRYLEYAHFEKDGMLCHLPVSLLSVHGPYLRTLVGRVDEAATKVLSKCECLEAADVDLPSIVSLQHMDCLQNLHTLRVSFRAEMEEEDRDCREEDRINPILPHFSQRLLRLSIYQFPTAYVIPESFIDILSRYKDHLESLEIGRVHFRHNYHGIQVMRVIDQMSNLRLLGMGSQGWPAYPLCPKRLEVLKADMFSEWVSSVLEASKCSLKKVMVDNIPEIVAEHYLSHCENLDECIITFSALHHLNNMENLYNLTLQIPSEVVDDEIYEMCSPILSRVTYLQAEGKGGNKDDEILRLLGERCSGLKRLTLRGWSRETGRGSWMRSFRDVEWLTLDFTFQFRRSLVLRLVMGAMPKLRVLCFEDQEGEYGTISDLDKLQVLRPNIRIEGSWKESVPLDYNNIQLLPPYNQ